MGSDLAAFAVGAVALVAALGAATASGEVQAVARFHQQGREYALQVKAMRVASIVMGLMALVCVALGDEVLAWLV